MTPGRASVARDVLRQRPNASADRARMGSTSIDTAWAGPAPAAKRYRAAVRVGNRTPSPQSRSGQVRLRVGIDVVSVAEVAAALERFGDRYVKRVFTAREAAYCRAGAATAARLAVRFAAKEAAVKALEPERPWTD